MHIDGAWWMAAPYLVLVVLSLVLMRHSLMAGIALLLVLHAGFILEYVRNHRSVQAVRVDGHLRAGDPAALVALGVRSTPEFYATLLYGGGFDILYVMSKVPTPRRYPFDDAAGPASLNGTRYARTNAAGCERYTFQDFERMRRARSADTYRCLEKTDGDFALGDIGREAVIFADGPVMSNVNGVRVSGRGMELRRRRNGADELVALDYATGPDFDTMRFLQRGLRRQ